MAKAWNVTNELGSRMEPLIPVRRRSTDQSYASKVGCGRKPKEARLVFEAIVSALSTGCQSNALPAERYASPSAIHAQFLEREKDGVFAYLWKLGLAERDGFEGIAWRWQSIDGAAMNASKTQTLLR